jgi:hypothetical protein
MTNNNNEIQYSLVGPFNSASINTHDRTGQRASGEQTKTQQLKGVRGHGYR